MVSLHATLLCVGLTICVLAFGTNAEVHKIPGKTNVHRYTLAPTMHRFTYKVPGKVVKHHYQYKVPGEVRTHKYSYQLPGQFNTHRFQFKVPGDNGQQTTGVYFLINVIYNYFAVGGHLTGIPPFDLVLLRYYLAQGPKSFCPK